jgi:predicted DNA-binding transcriptional regulator YafY
LAASERLLALLGLLQTRSDWSGQELAERLDVTDRTVRNDIERLRDLGYPVEAVRGPGGFYRLGVGTKLPPLLLDDDEAIAVAVGLRAGAGISGIEETSVRALAKLEHVLPHRLRREVSAIRDSTSRAPENTGINIDDPEIDPSVLGAVAAAIRDHQGLRVFYRDQPQAFEPYRLISWQRRWFLVGRDPATDRWAPYRLDWVRLRTPGGPSFAPRTLPGEDFTAFVLREVAFAGWNVHARITVDAPAEEVLARINPTVGVVERVDAATSILVTGGDTIEIVAVYIGMLGLDFHVDSPPELVEHVALLSARYARAVAVTPESEPGRRSGTSGSDRAASPRSRTGP